MKQQHPAVSYALRQPAGEPHSYDDRSRYGLENTTSLSLARALAVGLLARLDSNQRTLNIWDPAAGSGFAGHLLAEALRSSSTEVRYRGQEINEVAASASRLRFEAYTDADVAVCDSLGEDAFKDYVADLVIVDAPWAMSWGRSLPAVKDRQRHGEFRFGLPQQNDSTWLFISLALEKLRPAQKGGGRVAALVTPSALSSSGKSALVRQRIVEEGLLESVTRLPDGLALNTSIPLYLLTFTNAKPPSGHQRAMIADLQTLFSTEARLRSMPVTAFQEFESGLRTGKPGPRNRMVSTRQFIRRDAQLLRHTRNGESLTWSIASHKDTPIDEHLLDARYGPDAGVSMKGDSTEIFDLDPNRFFGDDSRAVLADMEAKNWPTRRLSSMLVAAPMLHDARERQTDAVSLFVPTTTKGLVSSTPEGVGSTGRILAIELDDHTVQPEFLVAWLNSDQGRASRQLALDNSASGSHFKALRSDTRSLMRWADELLVPVPEVNVQLALASADEQLGSFQADLNRFRESIWTVPDNAEDVVGRVASAFNDSLTAWAEQLPFPIASALWTAEIAKTPIEQQRAYLHAWEAIVTFHATVLLSACRSDPGNSVEIESSIRKTLQDNRLGVEKASYATWVVIVEKASKELRRVLEDGDSDDVARIRRAFADLGRGAIERLISTDIVKKFKDLNHKRNRWSGHTGFLSEQELKTQIESLIADLRDLRGLLGNVWSQLLLVRAGGADRSTDGYLQSAEVVVGTRSPFAAKDFNVGDMMMKGGLYLVRDGAQSPLPLSRFVQLRGAPDSAQFTSYFYNRTEGSSVRMVSYQYGAKSEVDDDVSTFLLDFGALTFFDAQGEKK